MSVVILDQVGADRLAWTPVDSGDDGRQLTGDLDAQALARFVLDDAAEIDASAIGPFEFQYIFGLLPVQA